MKKVSIEITDETHAELLKLQLRLTLENDGKRIALAKVIADFLENSLVKEKHSRK